MAIRPLRIESAPSEGPTVRSSRIVDRRRQRAGPQHDREVARLLDGEPTGDLRAAPGMRSRIRGAEYTLPSRTMARRLPVFCSVTSPKIRVPVAVNSMATCQLPGELGSACTSARVSSEPVSSVRFWTTYGILRSAFVSLSMRRWSGSPTLRAAGRPRLLDRGLLVEQP